MRLLRPFGPDAFPTLHVWRVDSTSRWVRTFEFNWVWYAGGGSGGRKGIFCNKNGMTLKMIVQMVCLINFININIAIRFEWWYIGLWLRGNKWFQSRPPVFKRKVFRFEFSTILSLCYCLQCLINVVTSWRSGGVLDCDWGEINVFRVDHQYLRERFSDLSFSTILSVCYCLQCLINVVTSWRSFIKFCPALRLVIWLCFSVCSSTLTCLTF